MTAELLTRLLGPTRVQHKYLPKQMDWFWFLFLKTSFMNNNILYFMHGLIALSDIVHCIYQLFLWYLRRWFLWFSRVLKHSFMVNIFVISKRISWPENANYLLLVVFNFLKTFMIIIRMSRPESFPTQLAWIWKPLKMCFNVVPQVLIFVSRNIHLATNCTAVQGSEQPSGHNLLLRG